jgi:hypothetical protein
MNAVGIHDCKHDIVCGVGTSVSIVAQMDSRAQRGNVVAYEEATDIIPNLGPVEWEISMSLDETVVARRQVLSAVVALRCSDTVLACAERANCRICFEFNSDPH